MKDLVKSVLKVFDGKQKRKLVGIPVYHSGNESGTVIKK